MKMKHRLTKICQSRLRAGMFLLCMLAMLGGVGLQPAAAQQQVKTAQVTGQVTDGAKQPLIGVTVTLVDTDVRTVTDVDGMFHINVPGDKKSSLEFNYIGFKKKVVEVSGAKLLNVVLDEDAGEVVSPNARQLYAAARYFENASGTIKTREGGETAVFCFD